MLTEFNRALRILKKVGIGADALAFADALWLARLIPSEESAPNLPPSTLAPPHPFSDLVEGPRQPPRDDTTPDNVDVTRPQRRRPPDRPAIDPDTGRSGKVSSIFAIDSPSGPERSLKASRVSIPAADALPGRAQIERALKPFLVRRRSRHQSVLDADATAEAGAQALIEKRPLVPVMRPKPERWFDVVLMIEQDDAMRIFDDTMREFAALLSRHGAFRRVRVCRWSATPDGVQVRSPGGLPGSPRSITQANGSQLLLLVTHGASATWMLESMRKFVRDIARHTSLAIIQMLPPGAWGFTQLGPASEQVRSRERAAPTGQLQRRDFQSGIFVNSRGVEAVPVMELEAASMAAWANFTMSPRFLAHAAISMSGGAVMLSPDLRAGRVGTADTSAHGIRTRVSEFRHIASARAFQLLRLLAAAPATVAVMRLLLQTSVGNSSITPICELLLSGLLRRKTPPDAPTQDVVFQFEPGVREWLAGSLTLAEWQEVDAALADARNRIRRFVEEKSGVRFSTFDALVQDPKGTEALPESARAFVEVTRDFLKFQPAARRSPPPSPPPIADLHNFPEDVESLIPRDRLIASLVTRVKALGRGDRLILLGTPGAGSQTLMATVLRSLELRCRFTGGIWFGTPCERAADTPPDALTLTFRFGKAPLGGDVRVELRYVLAGSKALDIGPLTEEEYAGYLRNAGVLGATTPRLSRVHWGIPAMVMLVAVGAKAGITRWPRINKQRPLDDYDILAGAVIRSLPTDERQLLIEASVWSPGFDKGSDRLKRLASDMGWLVSDRNTQTVSLVPDALRLARRLYPLEVERAQYSVVQRLRSASRAQGANGLREYIALHLLDHAAKCGSMSAVREVLFDRNTLEILMSPGRDALLKELRPFSKRNRAVERFCKLLAVPQTTVLTIDDLRASLAPPPTWARMPDLIKAKSSSVDGSGIRVGIIGGGIDRNHPEFQRIAVLEDTLSPDVAGTSVASVVAGAFIGVAPGAMLVPLMVAPDRDVSDLFGMVSQLNREDRPEILCVPLVEGTSSSDEPTTRSPPPFSSDDDVLVMVAAPDRGRTVRFVSPAAPNVLSVGALNRSLSGPATFSSSGTVKSEDKIRKFPDVWAPGEHVLVATPEPFSIASAHRVSSGDDNDPQPDLYTVQSGTSYACAYAAGIAALYAQTSGLRGGKLRELLLTTARGGMVRYDHKVALASLNSEKPEKTAKPTNLRSRGTARLATRPIDGFRALLARRRRRREEDPDRQKRKPTRIIKKKVSKKKSPKRRFIKKKTSKKK